MLIQFKNITLQRESHAVLTRLDLELREHRIGVVGLNGSGKSSFLRLINGLAQPSSGEVWVDGLNVVKQAREVRRKVGFIFQNPDNQFVLPMVREDIDFGLKRNISDRQLRDERVAQALARVGATHLAERIIHGLSGGERQLVALASVLAMSPEILLFDEPTTQLDLRVRNRLVALLAEMQEPCIIASHDLDLMAGMDRILVIANGQVAMDAAPQSALAWYKAQCQ